MTFTQILSEFGSSIEFVCLILFRMFSNSLHGSCGFWLILSSACCSWYDLSWTRAMHSYVMRLEAAEREVRVGDPMPLSPQLFLLCLLVVLKHVGFIYNPETDVFPFCLFCELNRLRFPFSSRLVPLNLKLIGYLKTLFVVYLLLLVFESIVTIESVYLIS